MPKFYERINELNSNLYQMRDYIVLKLCLDNVLSLNANIGYRYNSYINVKQDTIKTVDEFKGLWYEGFKKEVLASQAIPEEKRHNKHNFCLRLLKAFKEDIGVRQYVEFYLERSFLKNYLEYSRVKPPLNEILWIGDNSNILGIPIVPILRNGNWENDKSEVRKLNCEYWSIGHVLKSGLVYPFENKTEHFYSVDEYLDFFKIFVNSQSSVSMYENKIAAKYCEFVKQKDFDAQKLIPLLIPQFRYGGTEKKHKYRIDFMIVNPFTQKKYAIEISPYSTHNKKQQFIRDSEKINSFVAKYDMTFLEFTDNHLKSINSLFDCISIYLQPEKLSKVLYETSIRELLNINL